MKKKTLWAVVGLIIAGGVALFFHQHPQVGKKIAYLTTYQTISSEKFLGHSRIGELEEVSVAELIECFGPVQVSSGDSDGKTNLNWDVVLSDGTLATIYDYEVGPGHENGAASVADISFWHIGGLDSSVQSKVYADIEKCRARPEWEKRHPKDFSSGEIIFGGRAAINLEALKYSEFCSKQKYPIYYKGEWGNDFILNCTRWHKLVAVMPELNENREEYLYYCMSIDDSGQAYRYGKTILACDHWHALVADALAAQNTRDKYLIDASVPWQTINHTPDTTLPVTGKMHPGAVVNLMTRLIFYRGERWGEFDVIGGRGDGEIREWGGPVYGAFLEAGAKAPQY